MQKKLLLTTILTLLLAGCGQMGPLYLPKNQDSTKAPQQSSSKKQQSSSTNIKSNQEKPQPTPSSQN